MIRARQTERDEDIWSAIQYLDPDLADKVSNSAVIVAVLAIALLISAIWISLQLRGL